MRFAGFAVLVAALVLAGCTAGNADGVARPVERPTPRATPSEPPFYREVLAAQTKRVLMAQEALLELGGPTRAAELLDADFSTTMLCEAYANNEGRTGHVAHERAWTTSSFTAFNVAHGYRLKTGVEAVREARASAERCTAYHSNLPKGMYTDARSDAWDNIGYDLLGVVEFAKPDGVEDAYGRCMKETYPSGVQRVICFAYLGRKSLLSILFVTAGMDEAAAKAKLLQIIPIAATALASA